MLIAIVSLLVGLGLLAWGGDLLVRGAVRLALLLGVSAAVAGLTVVAAGTSAPELVVSWLAAWRGSADIAVANVVGSNIFNIGAVLGLCAVVRPLAVTGTTLRFEWPFLFLATAASCGLFWDGSLNAGEGTIFLISLVLFVILLVRLARREGSKTELGEYKKLADEHDEKRRAYVKAWGGIVVGSLFLVMGARWMLDGAVFIAKTAGLSERIIGLTVIGAGTGMPELAASFVAAVRKYDDVAIGNIVGSCIFNLFWILGTASLFRTLNVAPQIVNVDNWWMLGITVLLFIAMWTGRKISRIEGGILFAIYMAYVALLFRQQ